MCRQGLVRSVGLADVLKLHFRPVDVLPIGYVGNSQETQLLLLNWCDFVIVMEQDYTQYVPEAFHDKMLVCDVGPDIYKSSTHRSLIDQVWTWARRNVDRLGIDEHFEIV